MNRLAGETSPYLRQHADNPVDWFPWGEEAFAEARRRDVPLFVSIGYSACHWCHVMAHESFEDDATAELLNERFVNVKVDREERPDVDAVYMAAVQALTGAGGWPMSVFVDHDGTPFFAGTYFPPAPHPQRPAFPQLLRAIDEAWRERRAELLEQGARILEAVVAGTTVPASDERPTAAHVERGVEAVLAVHDGTDGGFGRAPKFPQPSFGELLLAAWRRSGDDRALRAVTTTLDAMASGGIYDHLGGGFARYSTDDRWLVPHFEKMLHDQALLARLYLHGWQCTGAPAWRQVLEETLEYVLRDLAAPGGGFCSAEDADSEGEEGRFYLWTPAEVRAAAGGDADAACAWWGVTGAGNFEGRTILHRPLGAELVRPPAVERARNAMAAARARRVRPGLDDKVLTEWNAMAVAVLAEAGAATRRDSWIAAAARTASFLLDELRSDDGRWRRSWQAGGGARHLAYAADHAWLVEAFTRLAEATGRARWIVEARLVADAMLELFGDAEGGGLFTTGADAERLVVRSKEVHDGATPSANAVAAGALLRLGALTGERRYAERARDILAFLAAPMIEHPTSCTWALGVLGTAEAGTTEIAVVGDRPDLVRAVQGRFLPDAVLAWGEAYPSPLWEGRSPGLAYVCRDHVCHRPVAREDELLAQLGVA